MTSGFTNPDHLVGPERIIGGTTRLDKPCRAATISEMHIPRQTIGKMVKTGIGPLRIEYPLSHRQKLPVEGQSPPCRAGGRAIDFEVFTSPIAARKQLMERNSRHRRELRLLRDRRRMTVGDFPEILTSGTLQNAAVSPMDFDKRLEKAIDRGRQTRDVQGQKLAQEAMSEEELRNLHSKSRLDLSEHIESCLKKLADHFPGFRFQPVISEKGWGARITRDDYVGRRRESNSAYSRFEMVIRPFSPTHIVELAAKATVQNKEIFNRSHFQFLNQIDVDSFSELIDLWALEYAEQFSARM